MGITALALLDGDHTILRYLAHCFSQQLTDFLIVVGRNGSHLLDLVVVVAYLLSTLGDVLSHSLHSLVDTTLQIHRISTSSDVLQTLANDSLGENGSSCCTITCIITSF